MDASTTDPQPGAWQSSNASSGPLAEDGFIRLRPLAASDVDAHLNGCDRIIINRLGGGEPSTATEIRSWLEDNARAWTEGRYLVDLGIEDAQTGLLVGCVGIQRGLDYLRPGQVNLTYAVYPRWRGRGYATRAVSLAMRLEGELRPVVEFVIRAASDNPESIAVARRAGFTYSHRTHDEHGDLLWLHLVA